MKKPKRVPIPAVATAERFDGGAVEVRIVFQPDDAKKFADQVVSASVEQKRN